MLVPLSWLKEYVDIDVEAKELEEKLFSCGFEVEESYAERGLQVPVLVQEPLVSVADAYACSPALATLVLEVENLQVGEVIGDKGYVKPQEMPLE